MTSLVGTNIFMQSNNADSMEWDETKPLITYSELYADFSVGLVSYFYQLTVWSTKKSECNEMSDSIVRLFDNWKRSEYEYSKVRKRTQIYDPEEKLFGIAFDVVFITRRYQ